MCGVVGYIGKNDCVPVLINGLSKLEYRGYDSAGIAVFAGDEINVLKAKGRLANLEKLIEENPISGFSGIGHTRWATHGAPSDVNSHPHFSNDSSVAVIHNGIIENYMTIKEQLMEEGYTFKSETDTEIVANLVDKNIKKGNNLLDALYLSLEQIRGSYALGVISKAEPDKIVCVRKDSPLIIGLGDGENFIASDMPAILNYTKDIYLLDEDEVAVLTKDSVKVLDKNKNEVKKEVFKVNWDMESAEKGGYDYFMLKEIFEQPKVCKDTISGKLLEDKILFDNFDFGGEILSKINKIYIVACGTAYYAGLYGKSLIENMARIPVVAEVASEFRYNDPIIDDKTLLIVVSQSGETADTLAALRLAKQKGAKVLSIVNVVGSSIARDSDYVYYTVAGPEIAVASTKAFTSQVVTFYMLSMFIALETKKITIDDYKEMREELLQLPRLIDEVLNGEHKVNKYSKQFLNAKNVFYIGRGLDYLMAMEGSLKLKEIAYLHSEPYAAGELKHGPIALIEDSTLVIGVVTNEDVFEKTISNLRECKARGAKILAIAMYGNEEIEKFADHVFYVPRASKNVAPILANVFQQMFAYHMAVGLNYDADKPRNLAKSVTVE